MKAVVGPLLLALSMPWNMGTHLAVAEDATPPAVEQVFAPTVKAIKDGAVRETFSYAKKFLSLKECQDFVTSNDPEFLANTNKLFGILQARGDDAASLTCEEVKPKPSI